MEKLADDLHSPLVAIVFDDQTLGGTSRSAGMSAAAWRSAGWSPILVSAGSVPEDRKDQFLGVAEVCALDEFDWNRPDLVHLHQNANERLMRRVVRRLEVSGSQSKVPILTHNVFGYPDNWLDDYSGAKAVGVLGVWSAGQYRLSAPGLRRRKWPWIIGNPQDSKFFRPPTESEKISARRQLCIGNEQKVVLRLGSPTPNKWSQSYLRLAQRLDAVGGLLLLAGLPEELSVSLDGRSSVRTLELMSRDEDVRRAYWAADVVAVDACRGESFGNVITESMLCGVPVVYRARQFRDNTPWEFRDFSGFYYCKTERHYLESVFGVLSGVLQQKVDGSGVGLRYGVRSTGRRLDAVGSALLKAGSGVWLWAPSSGHLALRPADLVSISVLHNPLASTVKSFRRRVHLGLGSEVSAQ